MGTKPSRVAPVLRAGLVVLVVVAGLGAGFGTVALISGRGGDGAAHRRPLIPSVAAFKFPTRPASTAGSAPVDASPSKPFTEPLSARGAVEAFLSADRDGDADTGYRLLAAADQADVGSRQAWAASRSDRARTSSAQVLSETPGADGVNGVDVVVAVTRQPSLDPFNGFVSAKATQTWRAVREHGGWRVHATPVAEQPVLPPLSAASTPAMAWVKALESCDLNGAARLQAGLQLYGSFDLVGAPCQEHGVWTAGAPVGVDSAADVQPLLESYGPDVPSWARLVPVQGPHTRFFVELAPVGDDWRVIGVTGDGG